MSNNVSERECISRREKADKLRLKVPEYLKLSACCKALGVDENSTEANKVLDIILSQRS